MTEDRHFDSGKVNSVASLCNKTILVTRPREQAGELVREIEKRGGRPVVFPTIRILEPESWAECDGAIEKIGDYAGIVFTSVNGAGKFLDRCTQKGAGISSLQKAAMFAVGEKTRQELERRGLPVRHVPERFTARSLSEHFTTSTVKGKRFLCPRGNLGREELADALRDRGALVDSVTVYITAAAEVADAEAVAQQLANGEIDIVTFASPSAARQFAQLIPPGTLAQYRHRARIAVIGPTTEKAVIELGFPADIVAKESTAKGIVDAIEKFFC